LAAKAARSAAGCERGPGVGGALWTATEVWAGSGPGDHNFGPCTAAAGPAVSSTEITDSAAALLSSDRQRALR
jgi:hypothetical protein